MGNSNGHASGCMGRDITPAWAAERLHEAHGLFTAPERLVELASDPERLIRLAAAGNPLVPRVALDILVDDADVGVRIAVAQTRRASSDHLNALAKDSSTAVRIAVAEAHDLPAQIRAALARDREWRVRRAVAADPRTCVDLLMELANDARDEVRTAAYANPASTPAVRSVVEQRPTVRIRERDAGSLFTSPEHLARLALDPAASVRAEVARNDATPAEIIRELMADTAREVRALAAIRGVEAGFVSVDDAAAVLLLADAPEHLIDAMETTTAGALVDLALAIGQHACLVAAASAPCASPSQLQRLLAVDTSEIRRAVVNNASTTAPMLDALARLPVELLGGSRPGLPQPGVIHQRYNRFSYALAVAQHPNTAEHTLQWLLHEGSPLVLIELARRPVLSMLVTLASDSNDHVRLAVASQALTPAVVLSDLAHDEWWRVRAAVHANPNADPQARATAERLGSTEP